jgi:hypothetical protein
VRNTWAEQAKADWRAFLQYRAAEMHVGQCEFFKAIE